MGQSAWLNTSLLTYSVQEVPVNGASGLKKIMSRFPHQRSPCTFRDSSVDEERRCWYASGRIRLLILAGPLP